MPIEATDNPRGKSTNSIGWCGGLLFLPALFLWQLCGPSPRVIISKETTYITAPLRPDGMPDYKRHVLEAAHQGVTPENNAAVLLWQATWPGELSPPEYPPLCNEIGLAQMP